MTPLDVENQRFHHAFRGYRREEVDEFLEKLMEDYTSLYNENRDLREKALKLEAQVEEYHRLKESIERSVTLAQKTADESIRHAQDESRLILEHASVKAGELVAESREKVEEMTRALKELERRKSEFAMEFRILLETHMRFLQSNGNSGRMFVETV